jgi:hypothetical protein
LSQDVIDKVINDIRNILFNIARGLEG